MDALLAAAPDGVLDGLIESLVAFSLCGGGLAILLWGFGFIWEMIVGLFRDII